MGYDITTPILMANGQEKLLGDVKVGDSVLNGFNKPVKVYSVSEPYSCASLYELSHLDFDDESIQNNYFLTPDQTITLQLTNTHSKIVPNYSSGGWELRWRTHCTLKPYIHNNQVSPQSRFDTCFLSNPCNPTGQIIEGKELRDLVEMANEMDVTTILDEFYSWYLHEGEEGRAVSAAEYIEDVNSSPLILIDGLTKNWRCPGWRVCWVVGPKGLISALNQAGSFGRLCFPSNAKLGLKNTVLQCIIIFV